MNACIMRYGSNFQYFIIDNCEYSYFNFIFNVCVDVHLYGWGHFPPDLYCRSFCIKKPLEQNKNKEQVGTCKDQRVQEVVRNVDPITQCYTYIPLLQPSDQQAESDHQ